MNISAKAKAEFGCRLNGEIDNIYRIIILLIITFIIIYPSINAAKGYLDNHNEDITKRSISLSKNSGSISAHRALLTSNVMINGKNNAEILCGDSINIEFNFFPGRQTANLSLFIDLNQNGIFDNEDLQYGKSIVLKDGDYNDEDKKVNSFYKTVVSKIPGEEIPVNYILEKTIFLIIDDGIHKNIASLLIKPAGSSLISGLVSNPRNRENLVVIARTNNKYDDRKYLAFTDKYGYFRIYLPDNKKDSYYYISSEDRYNVLHDNYFEPLPAVVLGSGKVTLQYTLKTSFLSGRIIDQNNNPVRNVKVYAKDYENPESKPFFSSVTDSSGFYRIGVSPGIYKISFSAETLFPDHMYPEESEPVGVLEGQVKDNITFTSLKSNGYIRGKVIINGKAAKDIYIAAWNDQGSVWQKTSSSGIFMLKVNKSLNYHVDINPDNIPLGCYEVNPDYNLVKPDTGNINFAVQEASVRLEGTVTDKNSNCTLENILISVTDGKRTIFTKTDSNGHFAILGDSGNYYLMSSAEEQLYSQADTNLIANNGDYHINFFLMEQNTEIGSGENNLSNKLLFNQVSNSQSGKETVIKYTLPKFSRVILKIYDLTGNEVATLEDRKKTAGVYEINFDSSKFTSGIYLCKLKAGPFSETRKFIIAK